LWGCKSTYISEHSSVRHDIVSFARQQIGDKYQYAAQGPNKFDCSGLVKYVYTNNGIFAKGSANHLSKNGPNIKRSDIAPGDLIFYKRGGRVVHVSIISKVTGNQVWVVHSTSSKGVIEQEVMASSYWKPMIYKIISLDSFKSIN